MTQVRAAGDIPSGYEGNDPVVEQAFAIKAIKHADSYFNLCRTVRASTIALSLHKQAEPLLSSFQSKFPHLTKDKLKHLNEDVDMKSREAVEAWRAWIKEWEDKIDDYNFGTLLRSDSQDEYSEQNSMFVTRVQFLAIEVARCSMGLNDWIYEKEQAEKAS